MPTLSRPRPGFTLIELLVVIAIIAILAAILFPVFSKARQKAWQTTCMNNQRQIAVAILMYAQDNNETFPPVAGVWSSLALPTAVLLCPAEATANMSNTYGYVSSLAGTALGDLTAPSSSALTADWSPLSTNTTPNMLTMPSDVTYRHPANSLVAAYADGHVSSQNNTNGINFTWLPPGYLYMLQAGAAGTVLQSGGIPATNGTQVTQWNSTGGGTGSLYQPSTGSGSWWTVGPTYNATAGPNNGPALQFTNCADPLYKQGSVLTVNTDPTQSVQVNSVVFVVNPSTPDANEDVIMVGTDGTNGEVCAPGSNNPFQLVIRYSSMSGTNYPPNKVCPLTKGSYQVFGFSVDNYFASTPDCAFAIGANGVRNSYLPAQNAWITTGGSLGFNAQAVGAMVTYGRHFNGYIAAILAYGNVNGTNTILSEGYLRSAIGYMKGLYGISP